MGDSNFSVIGMSRQLICTNKQAGKVLLLLRWPVVSLKSDEWHHINEVSRCKLISIIFPMGSGILVPKSSHRGIYSAAALSPDPNKGSETNRGPAVTTEIFYVKSQVSRNRELSPEGIGTLTGMSTIKQRQNQNIITESSFSEVQSNEWWSEDEYHFSSPSKSH